MDTRLPGSQIRRNSSTVRQDAKPLAGFATRAIPSQPTMISIGSTPLLRHRSSSSSWIARDASAMSASPAQNFRKPPVVPEIATLTLTPRWSAWNSSATASVIGYTVLDPSTTTDPSRPASRPSKRDASPQLHNPSAAATKPAVPATLGILLMSNATLFPNADCRDAARCNRSPWRGWRLAGIERPRRARAPPPAAIHAWRL